MLAPIPLSGQSATLTTTPLAATTIGLYRTELIKAQGPWRDLDQAEAATLEWVHWHNTERIHQAIDDPPRSQQKNFTTV